MTAIQTWWHVVLTFLKLSLFSIGGGNTLLQAYHHEVVESFGWLTNRQFSDLYGLAEAAQGQVPCLWAFWVLEPAGSTVPSGL